ncbi:UDP-glycosyltransferase UGT4-like [Planococcus citri]|uniref:UDP-glycosyltransferase UGT4-like n=1 Tax=Planococcus citri TaxID=170843 RepID=UPI0031F7679C
MKRSFNMLLIIILVGIVYDSHGANILVYLPSLAPSHAKPFYPLFIELAKRGHNVTMLSRFPLDTKIENCTYLPISDLYPMPKNGFAYFQELTRVENYIQMHNIASDVAVGNKDDPNTRFIFQSKSNSFDIVMTQLYHMDSCFALAGHFHAPIIGLSFQSMVPVYNWILKNPMQFSYIPHLYLPFSDDMDFVQRLSNTLFGVFSVLFYHIVSLPKYQSNVNTMMKSVNNADETLNFEQLTQNLSLILVESHFSVDFPKPNLPNVIDVAGIHITPPKPLQNDIADFIDGARTGIIYISLGTLIDPITMTAFGQKLFSILKKFPEHRVIWKWNPKLVKNRPDNFLIREWLPQADILRHPKTKLFISHGGHHSVIESVHGGVPILCFPFFTDQHHSAAVIKKYDFGLQEDLEANEHDILEKIQQLLFHKKYAENAKKQSIILKDRPMNPMNLAVYWTEYVIRHKGALHLKSAATQLSWYKYLLLDVAAFCIFFILLFIYIMKFSLAILYKSYSKISLRKLKKC